MEIIDDIPGSDSCDIDINDRGIIASPKTDKIALIDADTLLFGVCLSTTVESDVLPPEFYTKDEWGDIVKDEGFDLETMTIRTIDLDLAYEKTTDRLKEMCEVTGCCDWETHFTVGRKSFRYTDVDINYKANRKDPTKKAPLGLFALKKMMCEKHGEKSFMFYEYEADDTVVAKKIAQPDKYVMCAVDKDLLFSIEGRHWNYYASTQWNIDPKWMDIDAETAIKHHYIQTLTGDATDGIIGLHRVGKKTAEKILAGITTEEAMWDAIIAKYKEKGRSEGEALMNMRLVSMHQVSYDVEMDTYSLKLWNKFQNFKEGLDEK